VEGKHIHEKTTHSASLEEVKNWRSSWV